MNNRYTEIAFVLDRSGSMESCRQAAIDGFNRFLADQQNVEGRAKLTLVLFDDEYLVPVRSIPVPEVLPLNDETYVPRNSTALLDAIGQTIEELGARLAALPEKARPGQVIVAILTDGEENSSERFTWKDVAARIREQSETYKWTFLFLGANQDAIATAGNLNIHAHNAASYVADDAGAIASQAAFSRKASALRRSFQGPLGVQEAVDLNAPLSSLVEEEDKKQRGSKKSKSSAK